ncbi:hypothetical protein AKO1_011784 [Acrasis kona]|uniref:Uncharacterized protein n=1 Tax=Acrasis kona TaxID=1008807 RepID=A0AAW2Z7N0_9EUKA
MDATRSFCTNYQDPKVFLSSLIANSGSKAKLVSAANSLKVKTKGNKDDIAVDIVKALKDNIWPSSRTYSVADRIEFISQLEKLLSEHDQKLYADLGPLDLKKNNTNEDRWNKLYPWVSKILAKNKKSFLNTSSSSSSNSVRTSQSATPSAQTVPLQTRPKPEDRPNAQRQPQPPQTRNTTNSILSQPVPNTPRTTLRYDNPTVETRPHAPIQPQTNTAVRQLPLPVPRPEINLNQSLLPCRIEPGERKRKTSPVNTPNPKRAKITASEKDLDNFYEATKIMLEGYKIMKDTIKAGNIQMYRERIFNKEFRAVSDYITKIDNPQLKGLLTDAAK